MSNPSPNPTSLTRWQTTLLALGMVCFLLFVAQIIFYPFGPSFTGLILFVGNFFVMLALVALAVHPKLTR